MKNEMWKDIPGYECEYQASTLDRIKSLELLVLSKNHFTGKLFHRTVPERIFRPGRYCKAGHLSVVLRRGTSGQPVHRLIMRTFVGTVPGNLEVLHNNGDHTDNRLENLRYGTRTENILDVYRQGGRWRKLSIDDVEAIRFGLCSGISGAELSRMFDVSQSVISAIKYRRTYSWMK